MRKSRIRLSDVSQEIIELVEDDSVALVRRFDSLDVKLPTWATVIMIVFSPVKLTLDVMFFEETQEFFVRYARVLIKKSDAHRISCLTGKEDLWQKFNPPTLVGENLTTQLRPPKKSHH